MTRPRRRPRCATCGHLKAAVTIAKGDLGDSKSKLARTQARHPEKLARYIADVEDRKASLAYAEAELERHLAECQVIISSPQPATIAPQAAPEPQQQGARLRFPLHDDQPWADRALCAQTDPEAFFPDKGGSTREAKRVCMACPVRTECLDYAVEHQERFGIWGGLSERERRKLIEQRNTTPAPAAAEGAA